MDTHEIRVAERLETFRYYQYRRGYAITLTKLNREARRLEAAEEKSKLLKNVETTELRKLDFPRALFERDMATYSAGQKKKALLARSLCEQAHLYLWDEPLNFIDIFSRMQLEDLLTETNAALLFVEHDRMFTDRVATGIIELGRP